jgi:hypothetical protein
MLWRDLFSFLRRAAPLRGVDRKLPKGSAGDNSTNENRTRHQKCVKTYARLSRRPHTHA